MSPLITGAILGTGLLGALSQVLLKLSLGSNIKKPWLYAVLGGPGFLLWLWLLLRGFPDIPNSGCFIMLSSLLGVLLFSTWILKEKLSITKFTAYLLVGAGIWIIYFPPGIPT